MKINGILIKETGEIIYSRAPHDFNRDLSGKYGVDGGQELLTRTMFEDKDGFDYITFDLDVTKEDLYNDWNTQDDKYGRLNSKDIQYTIHPK